ncbi:MAG TPA: hypothetical protein VFG42_01840 [Baekduia sp.]|uniref:hypothetical protein n=1 Tax=Baekduia sp. TaxID=2600305 RepID=UPI002D7941C0|nr:hypothetical protein [Baekduia sp.]HET6505506.1 hypothetical protein [Baekduia sp.]
MLRPALLLALAAWAAAPAAAQAVAPPHRVLFDVKTYGEGSMKVHYHREDPASPQMTDETYNFDFAYESDYQDVRIVDGKLVDTGVRPIQTGVVTLHDASVIERQVTGDADTYACDDAEIIFRGDAEIDNDDFGSDVSTPLMWRPAEHLNIGLTCPGPSGVWHTGWELTQPGGEAQKPLGQGPLDLRWDLPYEVLWMDHFEQHVTQEPFQKGLEMCPGFADDKTIDCTLRWSGKVVMDRVRDDDVPVDAGGDGGSDVVVDLPPPSGPGTPPAPAGPSAPAAPAPPASGPRAATPVPKATGARLARDRKHITFTVSCPGAAPCSGRATAKGAKARRFTVKAGARRTITLTLAKTARRGTKTTVSVALTPKGGATTRTVLKA